MYQIVVAKKIIKAIDALPKTVKPKVLAAIGALGQSPRPSGCKKLVGTENEYRIKVDVYRIVYTIEDKILTITIIAVDHRKDIYK
jgi:mRNA interferase RelE/StbE